MFLISVLEVHHTRCPYRGHAHDGTYGYRSANQIVVSMFANMTIQMEVSMADPSKVTGHHCIGFASCHWLGLHV